MAKTIHRAGLSGKPQCGGSGAISTTGHSSTITCNDCSKPAGIPFPGRDYCGYAFKAGSGAFVLQDGTIRCVGCYNRMAKTHTDNPERVPARFGVLKTDMQCGDLNWVSPKLRENAS